MFIFEEANFATGAETRTVFRQIEFRYLGSVTKLLQKNLF
jgi:hypothetical protein